MVKRDASRFRFVISSQSLSIGWCILEATRKREINQARRQRACK